MNTNKEKMTVEIRVCTNENPDMSRCAFSVIYNLRLFFYTYKAGQDEPSILTRYTQAHHRRLLDNLRCALSTAGSMSTGGPLYSASGSRRGT